MSRIPRILEKGYSYHITIRCNNREFRLTRLECRQVLVYAIKKAIEKYNFKLYGLCIMSNHIHYLIEPKEPQDLPRFWVWNVSCDRNFMTMSFSFDFYYFV